MLIRKLTDNKDSLYPEASSLVFNQVYGDSTRRSDEERIAALCISSYANYCAQYEGQLLAVGTIDSSYINIGVALLTNIVVSPSNRRTGIGRELVTFLESKAKEMGACVVRLESLESAYDFYRRIGYQPIDPSNKLSLGKLV